MSNSHCVNFVVVVVSPGGGARAAQLTPCFDTRCAMHGDGAWRVTCAILLPLRSRVSVSLCSFGGPTETAFGSRWLLHGCVSCVTLPKTRPSNRP